MTAVRALLVIVLNAAVQAGLIAFATPQSPPWQVALGVVASGLSLLLTGLVLTGSAVQARGAADQISAADRVRFIGWLLLVLLIGFLGNIAWPNAGTLVAGMLAVLPVAALAGWPGIRGWAATIRERPIKWFFVTIAIGIALVVLHLAAGINTFFVGGWVGAAIAWIVIGLFAWWWLRALAGLVPKHPAEATREPIGEVGS